MGDVVVDEGEWWKLARELHAISEDAGKVNSFMVKHVNTKWEVLNVRVGLFAEFALIRVSVQGNGAPVWLIQAAFCNKNVLQWLADKRIRPPALDSWVRHGVELGDNSCVMGTMGFCRIMAMTY
jgi:hypothetical protein